MNFLAHCLLADGLACAPRRRDGPAENWRDSPAEDWRDGLLAGAILGDFVKGRLADALPSELAAGIMLHRRIDSYSNRLAEMKASIRRFPPALRRPAPVLLDLVADHCLALAWRRYAGGNAATAELPVFTARVYAALRRKAAWVPPRGERFVRQLIATDLLARYGEAAVIRRAMGHVLERLGFQERSGELERVLDSNLPEFQGDFRRYFPLLREFAAAQRYATPPP